MSHERLAETHPTTLSRRSFLTTAGGAVAGLTLADMLTARQAPAQIKGTNLRLLIWSHYVPAYDVWFDKFAKEWGDKTGVKVRVDHIPHLELPARYAAEFAAGAGHDLIYYAGQILTGQYFRSLVDLTDVADGLGKKYGGWLDAAKSACQVGGAWYAVPDFFISIPVLWRKDLFASVGMGEPKTWDDLRKAGGQLKAKGHPTGMQFSHCNDANHNWRALMYCFGVKETDPSGQNVTLDSKEMR
jgi:multiple sugar transport system substrate-binding protein